MGIQRRDNEAAANRLLKHDLRAFTAQIDESFLRPAEEDLKAEDLGVEADAPVNVGADELWD
jgi:hypothetical protein